MNGKLIYSIALLVTIVASVVGSDKPEVPVIQSTNGKNVPSNDLVVGGRVNGDHLAFKQNITAASKWLQIVTVEQTFELYKYERITQLRALNDDVNGNVATVSLVSGGPGLRNVTIRFESLRGHSINFIVEMYSIPTWI